MLTSKPDSKNDSELSSPPTVPVVHQAVVIKCELIVESKLDTLDVPTESYCFSHTEPPVVEQCGQVEQQESFSIHFLAVKELGEVGDVLLALEVPGHVLR